MKTERELFEKWCFDSGLVTNKMFFELGGQCDEVSSAWESWQASASRKGYKLVPIEATEIMTNDGCDSISYGRTNEENVKRIYKAMIGVIE